MKLLYIWNGDYGKSDFHNLGYNLSSKYTVEYFKDKNEISVKKNKDYISEFWGDNITDCFAVVGENGSGKTMLMNLLMNITKDMKNEIVPVYKYIVVFEDDDSEDIYVYYSLNQKKPKVDQSMESDNISITRFCIDEKKVKLTEKLKTAYFHNMLNRADYRRNISIDFDYSIGGKISFYSYEERNRHTAGITSDEVLCYFKHGDFNVIEFLYNYINLNTLNIQFPMPDTIYISIDDESFNTKYLIEEFTKRWENNQDDFAEKVKYFFETLNKIFGTVYCSWLDGTIKQVIMNCFKTVMFPGYVPKKRRLTEYLSYIKVFNEMILELQEFNLQNMKPKEKCSFAADKLSKLEKKINSGNADIVKNAAEFLNWLEKNTDEIKQFGIRNERCLEIKINNATEKFMKGLIDHYIKNSFAFPFYNFSFNLSTGESLLLKLFTDLYHMKRSNKKAGRYFYTYSNSVNDGDNILLIFDEAELSMHPRWQREYLKWILDFCNSFFDKQQVQIIVTTHSPILLSDFPSKNVLYLAKDRIGRTIVKYDYMKTFGNNIHTIYLNSFFLEEQGVIGAFAEKKINDIADKLFDCRKNRRQSNLNLPQIEKEIELIGEGVVKDKLLELYHQCSGRRHINNDHAQQEMMNETLNEMVDQLKEQKKQLEMMIHTLENEAGIQE